MPKILNAECKSAGPRVSQAGAGTDMGQSRTEKREKNKLFHQKIKWLLTQYLVHCILNFALQSNFFQFF